MELDCQGQMSFTIWQRYLSTTLNDLKTLIEEAHPENSTNLMGNVCARKLRLVVVWSTEHNKISHKWDMTRLWQNGRIWDSDTNTFVTTLEILHASWFTGKAKSGVFCLFHIMLGSQRVTHIHIFKHMISHSYLWMASPYLHVFTEPWKPLTRGL